MINKTSIQEEQFLIPSHTTSRDLSTPHSFNRFFVETQTAVYRYLYGLTGGPEEDVNDLTSETYIRAWKFRNQFQGDDTGALRWIFKIARNQFIDTYRHRKRRGEPVSIEQVDTPAPDASPELSVVKIEERNTLWRLLHTLPDNSREALVLRYMLEWSVKDIAAYQNKNETAVSMSIHRSLKSIQEKWSEPAPILENRSDNYATHKFSPDNSES